MKCFFHPQDDAVGMCTQCGKAVCGSCARGDGALRCKECHGSEQAAGLREELHEISAHVASAQSTIFWSWVVTVVFGALFLVMIWSVQDAGFGQKLFFSLLGFYAAWSYFWGCVFLRDKFGWRPLSILSPEAQAERADTESSTGCLWAILIYVFKVIAYLTIAGWIGAFGGGIYMFRQYRRIAQEYGDEASTAAFEISNICLNHGITDHEKLVKIAGLVGQAVAGSVLKQNLPRLLEVEAGLDRELAAQLYADLDQTHFRRLRVGDVNYCGQCGHDVRGTSLPARCPACGAKVPFEE